MFYRPSLTKLVKEDILNGDGHSACLDDRECEPGVGARQLEDRVPEDDQRSDRRLDDEP